MDPYLKLKEHNYAVFGGDTFVKNQWGIATKTFIKLYFQRLCLRKKESCG